MEFSKSPEEGENEKEELITMHFESFRISPVAYPRYACTFLLLYLLVAPADDVAVAICKSYLVIIGIAVIIADTFLLGKIRSTSS